MKVLELLQQPGTDRLLHVIDAESCLVANILIILGRHSGLVLCRLRQLMHMLTRRADPSLTPAETHFYNQAHVPDFGCVAKWSKVSVKSVTLLAVV